MKNNELHKLIEQSQAQFKILEKNKTTKQLSQSKANIRGIYKNLCSLTILTNEEKNALNKCKVQCIINMFSNERVFLAKRKEDTYTKEQILIWFLEAETSLSEMRLYYQGQGSYPFDYFWLQLDTLGYQAEYYYYSLLESKDENESDIVKIMEIMTKMFNLINAIPLDFLKKITSRIKLEDHCGYWLDKYLQTAPKTKINKYPTENPNCFTIILTYVNSSRCEALKTSWLKLCVLNHNTIMKLNYSTSLEIRNYFNSTKFQKIYELQNEEKLITNTETFSSSSSSSLGMSFDLPTEPSESHLSINPNLIDSETIGEQLSRPQHSLENMDSLNIGPFLYSPQVDNSIPRFDENEDSSSPRSIDSQNSESSSNKRKGMSSADNSSISSISTSSRKKNKIHHSNPLQVILEASQQLEEENQKTINENHNLKQNLSDNEKKLSVQEALFNKKLFYKDQELNDGLSKIKYLGEEIETSKNKYDFLEKKSTAEIQELKSEKNNLTNSLESHKKDLSLKDQQLSESAKKIEDLQKLSSTYLIQKNSISSKYESQLRLNTDTNLQVHNLEQKILENDKNYNIKIDEILEEKNQLEFVKVQLERSVEREKFKSKNSEEQSERAMILYKKETSNSLILRQKIEQLKLLLLQHGLNEPEETNSDSAPSPSMAPLSPKPLSSNNSVTIFKVTQPSSPSTSTSSSVTPATSLTNTTLPS